MENTESITGICSATDSVQSNNSKAGFHVYYVYLNDSPTRYSLSAKDVYELGYTLTEIDSLIIEKEITVRYHSSLFSFGSRPKPIAQMSVNGQEIISFEDSNRDNNTDIIGTIVTAFCLYGFVIGIYLLMWFLNAPPKHQKKKTRETKTRNKKALVKTAKNRSDK